LVVLVTLSPFKTKPDQIKQYGIKYFCKNLMNTGA